MGFEARYHGTCGNCGEHIEPGDQVRFEGTHVVHDVCDAVDPSGLRPGEVVCTTYWLVKPCECEVT